MKQSLDLNEFHRLGTCMEMPGLLFLPVSLPLRLSQTITAALQPEYWSFCPRKEKQRKCSSSSSTTLSQGKNKTTMKPNLKRLDTFTDTGGEIRSAALPCLPIWDRYHDNTSCLANRYTSEAVNMIRTRVLAAAGAPKPAIIRVYSYHVTPFKNDQLWTVLCLAYLANGERIKVDS